MEHNIKGPHTRGFSPSMIYGRESCGFGREGETPDFIPEGHIVLDGKSPLNTVGGSLGTGRIPGNKVPRSLVFSPKSVITTWRFYLGGKIISLNTPRHADQPFSQSARGRESPIFINFTE